MSSLCKKCGKQIDEDTDKLCGKCKKKARRKVPPAEDVIPESCYVDHAMVNSSCDGERSLFAAYTPHGIHQMEVGFREVIFDCCTTTELEGIRVQIRKNKHFHPRIKKKLLAQVAIVAKPCHYRYHDVKDYPGSWWPRRLTQQGIRKIDSEFCQRIMADPTGEAVDILQADIERNEHLHEEVKENLLHNLATRVQANAEPAQA